MFRQIRMEDLKNTATSPEDFAIFKQQVMDKTRRFYAFLKTRIEEQHAAHTAYYQDPVRYSPNRAYLATVAEAYDDIDQQLDERKRPARPSMKNWDAYQAYIEKYGRNEPGLLSNLAKAKSPTALLSCFTSYRVAYSLGLYRTLLTALAFWNDDQQAKAMLEEFTPFLEMASSAEPSYENGLRGPCLLDDMRQLVCSMVEDYPSDKMKDVAIGHSFHVNFKNKANSKDHDAYRDFARSAGLSFEFYLAGLYGAGKLKQAPRLGGEYGMTHTQASYHFVVTNKEAEHIADLLRAHTTNVKVSDVWFSPHFDYFDFAYAVNGVAKVRHGEDMWSDKNVNLGSYKYPSWDGIYKFPGVPEARLIALKWREDSKVTWAIQDKTVIEQFGGTLTNPPAPKAAAQRRGAHPA